jgi:hypothetical protein
MAMQWRGAWVVLAALFIACGQPDARRTAKELRTEIEAYEHAAPAANEDRIAALFAKLDAEIAALRADELSKPPADRTEITAQRETLEAERRDLQTAYLKARVARLGVATEEALRGMADQLGKGLEDAGRRLRDSTRQGDAP